MCNMLARLQQQAPTTVHRPKVRLYRHPVMNGEPKSPQLPVGLVPYSCHWPLLLHRPATSPCIHTIGSSSSTHGEPVSQQLLVCLHLAPALTANAGHCHHAGRHQQLALIARCGPRITSGHHCSLLWSLVAGSEGIVEEPNSLCI